MNHTPTAAAVEASDVVVRYGRQTAVDHVSLAVPHGSVYALLGRNGAGKSSLVRCALGQQKPESGSIALLGKDVWRHRTELMERVAVVAEESDAPPQMTVGAISDFCASVYRRWNQDAVDQRLQRFGVPAGARFGDLSKGQRKQVSLALALAIEPELLILDDPTLGLDVVARKSLFDEVIAELAERGITVLLTTHDLAGIETIADRVAIMKDGRLVLDEEMEALKSRFRRLRFASKPPELEQSALRPAVVRRWGNGAEAVVSNFDDLAFERFRSTAGVNEVEIAPMSLEEIFLAVAGEPEGAQS